MTENLTALTDLLSGFEDLRSRGHLDNRRTDLMSITGYGRDEQSHSSVLRWLLDPGGSHGLGSTILRDILVAGWDDDDARDVHRAIADREITRLQTRADVIVELGSTTLVIENKVDAPEQPTQCEDFYRHWGTRGRYLLLSPHGGRPSSAKSAPARRAWRSLAYGSLARLLESHLAEAHGAGRVALEDYVEALKGQFPARDVFTIGREDEMTGPPDHDALAPVRYDAPDPFDTPRLRFFLSNRPAIAGIGALEREFRGEFDREIQGLLGPIQQALSKPDQAVEGRLDRWTGGGPKHPLFWRSTWVGVDGSPLAAIGLAWDTSDPSRQGPYTGLFVRNSPVAEPLRALLRADQLAAAADEWVPGLYPVAYRYVPSSADWWTDIEAWRASLATDVAAAWTRFSQGVDAAVARLPIAPMEEP